MSKQLKCGDLMPGCTTVIEGKDEADVMAKAAEHAKADHNVTTVSPDLADKIRRAIRDR
jgi:predicted small metal-binding protein